MSFLAISGVLDADLAQAEAAVRDAETPEEVARSMVDREFWQAHLERSHPERFAAVDLPFRRQLERVLDDEALSEGAMIDQADAIRDAQRAARRGLMLDMTIQAMEMGPRGHRSMYVDMRSGKGLPGPAKAALGYAQSS